MQSTTYTRQGALVASTHNGCARQESDCLVFKPRLHHPLSAFCACRGMCKPLYHLGLPYICARACSAREACISCSCCSLPSATCPNCCSSSLSRLLSTWTGAATHVVMCASIESLNLRHICIPSFVHHCLSAVRPLLDQLVHCNGALYVWVHCNGCSNWAALARPSQPHGSRFRLAGQMDGRPTTQTHPAIQIP